MIRFTGEKRKKTAGLVWPSTGRYKTVGRRLILDGKGFFSPTEGVGLPGAGLTAAALPEVENRQGWGRKKARKVSNEEKLSRRGSGRGRRIVAGRWGGLAWASPGGEQGPRLLDCLIVWVAGLWCGRWFSASMDFLVDQ
ncbi:unnamed protein product [Calypogeia fissa]